LLVIALLNPCAPYFLNNQSFSRGHAQSHASQSVIHRGVCSASECAHARSSSFPHNFTKCFGNQMHICAFLHLMWGQSYSEHILHFLDKMLTFYALLAFLIKKLVIFSD
jgi:hypothetical protein